MKMASCTLHTAARIPLAAELVYVYLDLRSCMLLINMVCCSSFKAVLCMSKV
jgi:hypothetical protein